MLIIILKIFLNVLKYPPIKYEANSYYDGCSTMAGAKGGVATKIQQIEPKAVFTHCFGHALNLSVNDTIKRSSALKGCLDTCFELVKLIKFSPKREAMLSKIKEECGNESPSVRTICPTRWTVRADSLASIISNYDNIQKWHSKPPQTQTQI